MRTEQSILGEIRQLAQQWRGATRGLTAPNPELQRQFEGLLNELYEVGWDYALGWLNELPDEYLPQRYIHRRSQILDQLESELGMLAIQFRSSETRSPAQRQAIERYQRVMDEMFRIGHWHGEPDVEAQLPDELMPSSYHEFWRRLLQQ